VKAEACARCGSPGDTLESFKSPRCLLCTCVRALYFRLKGSFRPIFPGALVRPFPRTPARCMCLSTVFDLLQVGVGYTWFELVDAVQVRLAVTPLGHLLGHPVEGCACE